MIEKLKISPERTEFKEFCINDYFFYLNMFWQKTEEFYATCVHSTNIEKIGYKKQFVRNALVNIVI